MVVDDVRQLCLVFAVDTGYVLIQFGCVERYRAF